MSERIEIATPERVTVGYELAGVGSRMLAQIVDAGIIVVVYIALFFAAGGIAIASGILAAIVLVVVATFTPVGYFVLLEWVRRGSTPGKAALGLRVVRATGDPIGFTDSAVRNIVRIADFLPVAYLLGGVCALVSARGQRLGDFAAGTIVVRTGEAGVSTGTFADAVAEAGREAIPPDLIALAVAFRGRRRQLDEDVRRDLAARIAERIEPHHARPFGMGEEEFIIRAATRTLPGQAAS